MVASLSNLLTIMCPKAHLTNHREVPFLRRPHTTNEKRQAFVPIDDEPLTNHQISHLVRAKRKAHNLPDAWDYKPVSLWKHSEFTRRWLTTREKYRSPI